MRARIRDKTRAATCLGFGPRFQHSTGQAYKGGPNSGVFLQITCDDPADIDVPGHSYSFGVVKAAQAQRRPRRCWWNAIVVRCAFTLSMSMRVCRSCRTQSMRRSSSALS